MHLGTSFSNKAHADNDDDIKASAHSFKRFTSRCLKLSFSLYATITSDECQA